MEEQTNNPQAPMPEEVKPEGTPEAPAAPETPTEAPAEGAAQA